MEKYLKEIASRINDIPFDNEIKKLVNEPFEFEDCAFAITGLVHGTFDYCHGDYLTPPSSDLIYQHAEIDSGVYCTEDECRELSSDELYRLEELLKYEKK